MAELEQVTKAAVGAPPWTAPLGPIEQASEEQEATGLMRDSMEVRRQCAALDAHIRELAAQNARMLHERIEARAHRREVEELLAAALRLCRPDDEG